MSTLEPAFRNETLFRRARISDLHRVIFVTSMESLANSGGGDGDLHSDPGGIGGHRVSVV